MENNHEIEFEALTSSQVNELNKVLELFNVQDIFIGTHDDTTTAVYTFEKDLKPQIEDFLFHNYPGIHKNMRGV
jgi:hypothetical protein